MTTTSSNHEKPLLGYVRVSTEEQAQHGVSVKAQANRIAMQCAARAMNPETENVKVFFDEGFSGKSLSRPGLQDALAALKRGEFSGMVVTKLDRLSRSTRDVLELVARADREGWRLVSLSESLDSATPSGRFVLTILDGLAQMEREQIAERTREALDELRRQGKRVSGRPAFGYRFEGSSVVPVPHERALLQRLIELSNSGLGAQRIARAMDDEGILNPRTKRPWNRGTVAGILRTARRRARQPLARAGR